MVEPRWLLPSLGEERELKEDFKREDFLKLFVSLPSSPCFLWISATITAEDEYLARLAVLASSEFGKNPLSISWSFSEIRRKSFGMALVSAFVE